MTERVKCFNYHFNSRQPRYEINFHQRNLQKAIKQLQSQTLKKTMRKAALLYDEEKARLEAIEQEKKAREKE